MLILLFIQMKFFEDNLGKPFMIELEFKTMKP